MWLKVSALSLLLVSHAALANFSCLASSDRYPGIADGAVFSKDVKKLGPQGTADGHILLHSSERFAYWLVAGATMKIGSQPTQLLNFYVELHDKSNGSIIRAKSGQKDDPPDAHLELVTYSEESQFYEGMLLFNCRRYAH